MTKVIAGFPGVGKSYYTKQHLELKALDSDSSNFKWVIDKEGNKVVNKDFPNNYIKHIKDNLNKVDIIFVSTHKEVRDILRENNINYYLVYPSLNLKEEYIDRYKQRNSPKEFIELMDKNFEVFIKDIEQENFPKLIKLSSGQYIADILNLL